MAKIVKKQLWLTEAEAKMIQILRAYNLSPEEVLARVGLSLTPPKIAAK